MWCGCHDDGEGGDGRGDEGSDEDGKCGNRVMIPPLLVLRGGAGVMRMARKSLVVA